MARRNLAKKGRTADAERQEQGRQEQQEQGRRELRMVAVGDLAPAPWNARGEITPESVADLTASIKTLGLIEPLVASEGAGGLTLIAGHRRLAACREAGMESVPVWVMEGVSADRARRMTLIENLQREDADPLMESELVGCLVKSGMTQDEIAAETGRGQRWVARRMNLVRLSKSWRKRVAKGEQITTDCLEHVAAYPEEVQEKLKGAGSYGGRHGTALRWVDIQQSFACEAQDLKYARFDHAPCKTCPKNTGCAPDLFDWDDKPTALGKCLDSKCFKRKDAEAVKTAIADARAEGVDVRECGNNHPGYEIGLQNERDKRHNTLYVWKNYMGETEMQWGEKPRRGKPGGGMTDEEKDERRRTIARNKARRKLAKWCQANLAAAIAEAFPVDVQIAIAFQRVFDIGSSWRVLGSQTNAADAELAFLLNPDETDPAPRKRWAGLAAPLIAERVDRADSYARLLVAILPKAEDALTEEERRFVVSDDDLADLRKPVRVKWTDKSTDDEAEDAMLNEEEEND